MTIQWHFENRPGAGLLSVSGFLGEHACTRFTGAVGWALTRGQGTLIVDLTGLQGWSQVGRATLMAAAGRLAEQGRSLELAGVPTDNPAFAPRAGDPDIRCHRDLDAALAAHPGPAAE